MGLLWTTRAVVFATVVLFAIIDLGICAGFIAKLRNLDDGFDFVSVSAPTFAQFGIAVSVLTLITLGPMCVLAFTMCLS